MAKRKKASFTNEHSSIEDVEEYYFDSEDSLNLYYDFNLIELHGGQRFVTYSKGELNSELGERKRTLDRMCALEMLSLVEARIRIDYLVRSQDKLRDGLSKKMREVYRKKENRASLKDDILAEWKNYHPEHKNKIDQFVKALDYRNWLAHGRYWIPKKNPHIDSYDYFSVRILAERMLGEMDLKESSG